LIHFLHEKRKSTLAILCASVSVDEKTFLCKAIVEITFLKSPKEEPA